MKLIPCYVVALLIAVAIYFGGCSYRNVDTIKANAEKIWANAGFVIVGYEGYQIGVLQESPGGRVWYIVARKGDDRILYHGCITQFGAEFHIYSLKAIDAIAGK